MFCGEPLALAYRIGLLRPHHAGDRVGLYRLGNLYGEPGVCARERDLVPGPENEGSVPLDAIRSPAVRPPGPTGPSPRVPCAPSPVPITGRTRILFRKPERFRWSKARVARPYASRARHLHWSCSSRVES